MPNEQRVESLIASLPRHGDASLWRRALLQLPEFCSCSYSLGNVITIATEGDADVQLIRKALECLHPWRKGPFNLLGVQIDAEWRSDLKWDRVAHHVDLVGKRVLDVGCGNGYFGWRMLEAGASEVIGIDPMPICTVQYSAIARYLSELPNYVYPLRLESLKVGVPFDCAFSMGVIYHQRDAGEHLSQLHSHLQAGGVLVLESLVVDESYAPYLELAGKHRYARMRNIWKIPTPSTLTKWLIDAGFREPRIVDVSKTTINEQRSTAWMRFQSLAEALDPKNPDQTIDGYPAPQRAIMIAEHGGHL